MGEQPQSHGFTGRERGQASVHRHGHAVREARRTAPPAGDGRRQQRVPERTSLTADARSSGVKCLSRNPPAPAVSAA